MTRECQMFSDVRTLPHRGMKTSSKIYEKKEFAMLQKVRRGNMWGRQRGQARTEKENPNHRQMGLLGNDSAAREGKNQVPCQTSHQPCQQQPGGHPVLWVPHKMSFIATELESLKSCSFSHLMFPYSSKGRLCLFCYRYSFPYSCLFFLTEVIVLYYLQITTHIYAKGNLYCSHITSVFSCILFLAFLNCFSFF